MSWPEMEGTQPEYLLTLSQAASQRATDTCAEHQAATMTSAQAQHRKQGPHPSPG